MLLAIGLEDRLQALGMKCLTVAGGFVAGWVLGLLIAMGLNRWVFKRKMPEGLKQVLKVVLALVVAILVAAHIFGGDGSGTGTGNTGKAADSAADQNTNKTGTPVTDVPKDEKKPTPATISDTRPAEVTIRVTVLGGPDVVDERFYLIDDDRAAKTLADVKAELKARKAKEPRKVVVAILPSERYPLPLEHGGWTNLVRAVKDEVKLTVIFPESK